MEQPSENELSRVTVVNVETPTSQPSEENTERQEALLLGQTLEAHRQTMERQSSLEAENQNLREQVQSQGTELQRLADQMQGLTAIIAAAAEEAAETEEAAEADVLQITPEPEPELKTPEAEPIREPGFWEKLCDRVNGM